LAALSPLDDALADEQGIERLLEQYGWRSSIGSGDVGGIAVAFGLDLLQQARTIAGQLADGPAGGAALVQQLADTIRTMIGRLRSLTPASAGISLAPFTDPAFWPQFTGDLVNGLVAGWLGRSQPLVFGI